MTSETVREQFEKWAFKWFINVMVDNPIARKESGEYRYGNVAHAWLGWQAALSTQPQPEFVQLLTETMEYLADCDEAEPIGHNLVKRIRGVLPAPPAKPEGK